ncbi:two-component sensor histidine kinase [Thioclava sp. DLFJ5-1]|jgi:two-component system OmpR family sensor kinase|uniref:histidine kinase n=6 Tax=Rhodobacterales TaxID=204455 RepID=A0A291GIC8_9RHOB|nr:MULTISPECIES: ATP-binding protein [Rhodobacterales]MCE8548136.1 sensor histidine kinase N-terminal domain-containing protein [Ruegeria pomeroyi]ALG92442.1 histidine kinase [Actibacterium sp. EMB200-NS6]ATG49947.1 two-component sensor histidine kinase [Celeribacter ethanolicus]MBB4023743.1 two-component system OmpR family sensor kinase [Actibacterium naphthalenivorans]OOY18478.1 two-component sensor histidine kinase [Thioclava sp. DLFJ5-1]|tara:strand:+ start:161 stop:1498 length:1338 start_codon:yes stop_codon:yes gene_type:complete
MRWPASLQARLGLSVGLVLTVLWLLAATVTAVIVRAEMDEVFDSALRETAERILPLAVTDIVGREDQGVTQRLAPIRAHDEFFTYLVRDAEGRILLQSHAADPTVFPSYDGPGFRQTATHRLYSDAALQDTIRITVAEPLAHRMSVAREIQMGLGLPLLIVLPVALIAIILAVRFSLDPLRRFRARLEARGARDLSQVPHEGLPTEIGPLADTLNSLLARLREAFEAERSFAANAAHELRTPLAGAIAQAQRLRSETKDRAAAQRATDIEETLKRLTRRTERMMQLARAEGGRLRMDKSSDLRGVARIVVDDIGRTGTPDRIRLNLPDMAVMSDLDPDAFAILCRNLVENALRHGGQTTPVDVTLTASGQFTVANDGPVVPGETLDRLTARFERASATSDGSGLGLAIVAAIAERISSRLVLQSPRPGRTTGFQVSLRLPIDDSE